MCVVKILRAAPTNSSPPGDWLIFTLVIKRRVFLKTGVMLSLLVNYFLFLLNTLVPSHETLLLLPFSPVSLYCYFNDFGFSSFIRLALTSSSAWH